LIAILAEILISKSGDGGEGVGSKKFDFKNAIKHEKMNPLDFFLHCSMDIHNHRCDRFENPGVESIRFLLNF
jgi:hypothetical protein